MSELRKPYRPGNEEEIPAGLEYRPEMWDSALGLIENHEKVVFRRKLLLAASVVLLLALGTGFWDRNISSDGAQIAEQEDVLYGELRGSEDAGFMSTVQNISPTEVSEVSQDDDTQLVASSTQAAGVGITSTTQPKSTTEGQDLSTALESIALVDQNSTQGVHPTSEEIEDAQIQITTIDDADNVVDVVETTSTTVIENQQPPEVETLINNDQSDTFGENVQTTEATDDLIAIVTEDATSKGAEKLNTQEASDETNKNLPEGILSDNAAIGVQNENPIPLNIKQVNEEDSPLQYEPFAEGAPAPHEFSTEFMRLGQEPQRMNPRPYSLIANSTDFKKPQGVIVNLKQKELLLPLQQFNVQVMLGTSILSHYGSRKRELALSPAAGVGIDYNFKRRLSVNAQLQYFSVKNIQRDRVVVQEEIDFSLSTTTLTYNTEKLHYVSVPLNLAIRIKNRHQFSAGGGISYLIAANNRVKVEEESSVDQANVSEYEVKNVADGFALFNTYLNFGYNYYVTPNVTLGLRYQVGLTDVTLDNSGLFNNSTKDRNTRLAAYVRFNVF